METRRLSKPRSEGFQLSLRIRHPSMDPADISRALKLNAEHSFRAGDRRRSSRGIETVSTYGDSYWLGVLKPMGALVDIAFPGDRWSQVAQRQLHETTRSLTWSLCLSTSRFMHAHAELFRRIRSEGGQVSLLVTIYNGEGSSFTLAPEASQLFGELGIAVEFELAGD